MTDFLRDREKALENSFFAQRDKELLSKLAQEVKKEQLAEASGIHEHAVLESLLAANLDPETIAALALVPLVATAWADQKLDEKEREALVAAIESEGIAAGSVAHDLISQWLDEAPGPDLVAAWKGYIGELIKKLPGDASTALRDDVLGRAKKVAQAAGGRLGVGSISRAEKKVLDDLESAFSS